jgi:hypothetical protein
MKIKVETLRRMRKGVFKKGKRMKKNIGFGFCFIFGIFLFFFPMRDCLCEKVLKSFCEEKSERVVFVFVAEEDEREIDVERE